MSVIQSDSSVYVNVGKFPGSGGFRLGGRSRFCVCEHGLISQDCQHAGGPEKDVHQSVLDSSLSSSLEMGGQRQYARLAQERSPRKMASSTGHSGYETLSFKLEVNMITLKVFILPRVAELFIHKEKQSGCPLLGANRYTHIYISYICVYILFICLRL